MALKQDIAVLRAIPIFGALDIEPLRLVAFSAESRVYRAGDVLFHKGEPSDGGYVITSGAITLDPGDGAPKSTEGPGSLIGELALIVDTERPATALVTETASVLRIPRATFRRVMEEFPETAAAIRAQLVERAQAMSARLAGVRYELMAVDRADQKRMADRQASED